MLRDTLGFHIPFVPCSAAERNGHKYDYSWNNTGKVFVKLSDGTYALEYYISVKLVPKNALAKEAVETVKLLVYID